MFKLNKYNSKNESSFKLDMGIFWNSPNTFSFTP